MDAFFDAVRHATRSMNRAREVAGADFEYTMMRLLLGALHDLQRIAPEFAGLRIVQEFAMHRLLWSQLPAAHVRALRELHAAHCVELECARASAEAS